MAMNLKQIITQLPQQIALERGMPKLVIAVNLVLVAALGDALAGLTWQLLPGWHYIEPDIPAITSRAATTSPAESARPGLEKWHLFGIADARAPRAATRPEQMPETKLRLTLRGIMAGDTPVSGGAIIAAASGREQFYAIGSDVPGGAVLREVYADRVVLERNQQLETLRLPKESLDSGGSGATRQSSLLPPAAGPRKTLRDYRDELLTNPQNLVGLIRAVPAVENGRMQGYRVSPGRDASLFQRYGLQPGDVVTAVNGIALDNPAGALAVMRSLSSRDQLRISVLRNGRPMALSFSLDD